MGNLHWPGVCMETMVAHEEISQPASQAASQVERLLMFMMLHMLHIPHGDKLRFMFHIIHDSSSKGQNRDTRIKERLESELFCLHTYALCMQSLLTMHALH
ncbi:unnamed protein product [Orchesella dallaii]|uniref:Uncharacterized protein n=1 Tax=Orchesella dallaii TaxID=48710 RepID=A0ABP1Q8D7_9HEXA